MDSLHMILDVTHLTDLGFSQAMEIYKGPVWASHHNCRSLVKNQRQLTDDQIKILIERGAVIGGVMDAWMLTDRLDSRSFNSESQGYGFEQTDRSL